MKGYIYIITNTITNKQYVGQTRVSIESRFKQHINDAKHMSNHMYLHKSMNKYGCENFTVEEIANIECDTLDELKEKLNELEILYIKKYNTLSPCGYNLTKGGAYRSQELFVKVDEYDLLGNFIQTHESLIAAALSVGSQNNSAILKCCKGKSKFAFQRIWRYHGDDFNKYELPDISVAQRVYKKAPIDQYSLDGKFIASYESIVDVYNYFDKKVNLSHISECCKGALYTSYGYVWRYYGEPFDKYTDKKDKRMSKCQKLDLEGNVLGTYDSIKDACISINKDPQKCNSHITSCCKGERKTAYGYKWKYVD